MTRAGIIGKGYGAFGAIELRKVFRGYRARRQRIDPSEYGNEEQLTVLVGLDFGTCSTKVAYRIMPEEQVTGIHWRHNLLGYSPYSLPSTLTCSKGRLHFAEEGERMANEAGARTLRSLKRCLLCYIGKAKECKRPNKPCTMRGTDRTFILSARSREELISFGELVALYVSYIMKRVAIHVRMVIGPRPDIRLIFNAAAPVDLMGPQGVRTFENILFAARSITRLVGDSVDLAVTIRTARDNWRHMRIPRPERKYTWCFAEEDAALSSLVSDPGRESGIYCILDIGAGTSSLSFFFVPNDAKVRPSYFESRAFDVGCDDLDRDLADKVLRERQSRRLSVAEYTQLLHEIRVAKQESSGLFNARANGLTPSTYAELVKRWLEPINQEYWSGLGRAWQKCKIREYWDELRLIFVGGAERFWLSEPKAFCRNRTITGLCQVTTCGSIYLHTRCLRTRVRTQTPKHRCSCRWP